MNELKISASLVVYKPDLTILGHTLQDLEGAGRAVHRTCAAHLQLTLVDNSDDASWFDQLSTWLKDRAEALSCWEVSLLKSPGNIGYGRGNNLVIERSDSDYHFVINPDLFVEPDSLVQAVRFMEDHPDVGLLVPSIFGEDGKRHYLCKRNPTLFVLFLRSFAPAWFSLNFQATLDRFEMRDRNYDEIIDGVEFPSGCFMFFRTALLKRLGGFDPDYFMYFEDADIGRRVSRIARVIYVPSVRVVHKWERGTHYDSRLRRETIKSALIYWRKYTLFRFGQTRTFEPYGSQDRRYPAPQQFSVPPDKAESVNLAVRPGQDGSAKPPIRILLIVVYYLPSTWSSAKLIHDLATEFRRLGHDPLVAAPDDTIRTEYEVSEEAGIKVLRVRTGEIKFASRWLRAWREITLSRTMWRKGRSFFLQNPCDLIVYYSPTIFFGGLVEILKKRYACPSYLILRDIFPQWAVDAGVLRKGPVYAFFKWKERQNYGAADVIGVQSPANLDYFAAASTQTECPVEVLYNWASVTVPAGGGNVHRRRLGLSDKVVFFFGGNIGVAQDMDNILCLAERLRHESSAFFLLVGSGSEVGRLKHRIADRRLTNILIHDAVGQDTYLKMLSEFDVGLISLDKRLKNQNFPGKMLTYMNYSLPILASLNPGNDLGDLLEKREAGLVCLNGDDDRFEALARRLLEDRELRIRLGKNARTMLDDCFSVHRAARQILSHVGGNHHGG